MVLTNLRHYFIKIYFIQKAAAAAFLAGKMCSEQQLAMPKEHRSSHSIENVFGLPNGYG